MRSRVLLWAVLAAACLSSGGDPVPTTTTTTTTVATTATEPSTTTVAPSTTTLPALTGLAYEPVATGLPFPVFLTAPPGDERSFIATKDGRVWILRGEDLDPDPFLDIRPLVRNRGEQGLLGLAFPPDFSESGRFYVHFSAIDDGATMLMRYTVSDDPDLAHPASGELLLRVDQPASNHNGGMLQFGPDGYLYLGLGDGGGAGDAYGNGQNRHSLLAKILRFDVSPISGYAVPPDNPWVAGEGVPETWAWGLRNPWRFWIDEADSLIYIGDVGQNAYEEIDVAALTSAALNYGWPTTEALHCYRPSRDCDIGGLTLPVVEVGHGDAGTCSITGGVVYRGEAIPELVGDYFYSDYCGGWLRSFRHEGGVAYEATDWTDQAGVPGQVNSFGVDSLNEMYVTTTEDVFRIVPVR